MSQHQFTHLQKTVDAVLKNQSVFIGRIQINTTKITGNYLCKTGVSFTLQKKAQCLIYITLKWKSKSVHKNQPIKIIIKGDKVW